MKKLVSTLNQDKKEWLKYRKGGIGGSDAGAICGLNPYRTAIQVYNDKRTDEIEEFDNEAMREGRDLEEYVARRFMETTGKKVRRANAMFYDEENPFMLADVDRMIVGENAGLECKTASPFSADKWEDDKIPLSYQIQCYHYMSVMNADRWYVAVLIYGTEFKVYCLERDEEMIQNLIQIEKDFWNNHVQEGVIPAPDGSKLADKVLEEYFSDPVEILGDRRKVDVHKVIEPWEVMKSGVNVEVINYEWNQERLKKEKMVYEKILDLAIVFTVNLREDKDFKMTITSGLLEQWKITKDELISVAYENFAKADYAIISYEDVMEQLLGLRIEEFVREYDVLYKEICEIRGKAFE